MEEAAKSGRSALACKSDVGPGRGGAIDNFSSAVVERKKHWKKKNVMIQVHISGYFPEIPGAVDIWLARLASHLMRVSSQPAGTAAVDCSRLLWLPVMDGWMDGWIDCLPSWTD